MFDGPALLSSVDVGHIFRTVRLRVSIVTRRTTNWTYKFAQLRADDNARLGVAKSVTVIRGMLGKKHIYTQGGRNRGTLGTLCLGNIAQKSDL